MNRRRIKESLEQLKQHGCNILVTGSVPIQISTRTSRRLLGDPSCPRERIVCLVGDDSDRDRWVPPKAPDARTQIVVADSPEAFHPATLDSTLGVATRNAVKSIDQVDDDDVGSGGIRVCFYSLSPLLTEFGVDPTVDTLARFTQWIRSVRGIGHFHLPQPSDSCAVEDVQHVFDIEVQLRDSPGKEISPEWRWHLPNYGTTHWLPITEWES
jgi:hypothetical protein